MEAPQARPECAELRRAVAARFFTRVDPRPHADIYAVRRLPPEIRATLNGLYSRSHLSMRETFLRRLEKGLAAQGRSLADLVRALPERDAEDVLGGVLVDKAGEFLRTYAIDHGHNSLREGAVVQLAIENVSQLVTRFIERERRASFEESSTRYIAFTREGHWRDPEVEAAGGRWRALYEEALAESFGFYKEAIEALRAHLAATQAKPAAIDEKAWRRTLRAEAFDSARYLLTPALFTKFGMVADARTLSDTCRRLLSHPLAEFRLVGRRIREEAEKELPTLLAHAREDPYRARGQLESRTLAAALGAAPEPAPGDEIPEADNEVRLLAAPDDLDARLLASALHEAGTASFESALEAARALPETERARLFERLLGPRGPRDAVPEGFEGGGHLDFELLIDFGAYRDIARHRKGFQQQQALTTRHGFCVPPLFDEAGLGARYREVMRAAGRRARALAERFPLQAGYLIPFGYRQRVRVRFDTAQMVYFCELRSAPEGHFSYRAVARAMGEALREHAPLYGRYLRLCTERIVLGRAAAEAAAPERRAERARRAREKGFA